jgi:hypothetical protein
MIRIALLLMLAGLATAAPAAPGDKPLFASSDVLQLTIRGPVQALARSRQPEPATLSVAGTAEALPVQISARGLTRRRPEICPFPPLWVFTPGPIDEVSAIFLTYLPLAPLGLALTIASVKA